MDHMLEPLRKYAVFHGRARRLEYWSFVLFVFLGSVVASIIDWFLGFGGTFEVGIARPLWGLFVFIPGLAVLVRRLHDIDRTGWWDLLNLLPVIGSIILFIFCVLDGSAGPNRYGPDPKGRDLAGVQP